MPKIIVPLGDAPEKASPFTRQLKVGIVRSLGKISEGVPSSMKRFQTDRELIGAAFAMGRARKLELSPVTTGNKKNALTSLRHAIARGIEDGPDRGVVGL